MYKSSTLNDERWTHYKWTHDSHIENVLTNEMAMSGWCKKKKKTSENPDPINLWEQRRELHTIIGFGSISVFFFLFL